MTQNIVQFWPGVGLTLLAIIIPLIVISIIQWLLARKKSDIKAKIFIAGVFIIISIIAIMSIINGFNVVKTPIGEMSFSDQTNDDVEITIYAIYDKENEKVSAFSDLIVKNKITDEVEYFSLLFDNNGELVGNVQAFYYSEEISRLADEAYVFVGESKSIRKMKKEYASKHGNERIEIVILSLLYYIISIVQIIVHKTTRKKFEKEFSIEEIERMKIQEL